MKILSICVLLLGIGVGTAKSEELLYSPVTAPKARVSITYHFEIPYRATVPNRVIHDYYPALRAYPRIRRWYPLPMYRRPLYPVWRLDHVYILGY